MVLTNAYAEPISNGRMPENKPPITSATVTAIPKPFPNPLLMF